MLITRIILFQIILFFAVSINAATIPASSAVPGKSIGNGLNGSFYNANTYSNGGADAYIATHLPSATFLATSIDYPNGNGGTTLNSQSVGAFLGIDNPGITTSFGSSIFLFTGFIEITSDFDQDASTSPIDVNFAIRSDDGMRLKIGGVTVTEYASPRQFSNTPSVGVASFEKAGLYPVELLYWNIGSGFRGAIEWYSSIPGVEVYSGAPSGTIGIVPTQILSTAPAPVPIPAAFWLLASGIASLFASTCRKR